MDVADELRTARRGAGLSQRGLEARTSVPQSRIAEYETGRAIPKVDRLSGLLLACGRTLTAVDVAGGLAEGQSITEHDSQLMSVHLSMTPQQRLTTFLQLNRLRGLAVRS